MHNKDMNDEILSEEEFSLEIIVLPNSFKQYKRLALDAAAACS